MAKNYSDNDPCPLCKKPLQSVAVTEIFTYKGASMDYPDYIIHRCTGCGEEFVGSRTIKASTRRIRDFHREVDGLLTSTKIKEIRMRLGYTQDDFSRVLGGGDKAFARYENGEVTQAKSMDNLLRVLHAHPDAIKTIDPQRIDKRKSVIPIHVSYETKTEYSDSYGKAA